MRQFEFKEVSAKKIFPVMINTLSFLFLYIPLALLIAGGIYIYESQIINKSLTDSGKEVIFINENNDNDLKTRPAGEVYREELKNSLWWGFLTTIGPALIIYDIRKQDKKKNSKQKSNFLQQASKSNDSEIKSGFYDDDWERPHLMRAYPTATVVGKCKKCGNDLLELNGRFGKFNRCSDYPKCKEQSWQKKI